VCLRELPTEGLIERQFGAVQVFAGDEPQGDDMTCVALRVEERYGAAIEALDAAGKTGSAEALAAARWKRTELLEILRGPTTVASGGMRSPVCLH
jgi:hypothetical protein